MGTICILCYHYLCSLITKTIIRLTWFCQQGKCSLDGGIGSAWSFLKHFFIPNVNQWFDQIVNGTHHFLSFITMNFIHTLKSKGATFPSHSATDPVWACLKVSIILKNSTVFLIINSSMEIVPLKEFGVAIIIILIYTQCKTDYQLARFWAKFIVEFKKNVLIFLMYLHYTSYLGLFIKCVHCPFHCPKFNYRAFFHKALKDL